MQQAPPLSIFLGVGVGVGLVVVVVVFEVVSNIVVGASVSISVVVSSGADAVIVVLVSSGVGIVVVVVSLKIALKNCQNQPRNYRKIDCNLKNKKSNEFFSKMKKIIISSNFFEKCSVVVLI